MQELRELLKKQVIIDEDTGCWNWQRPLNIYGYGRLWWKGRTQYAHRLAYKAYNSGNLDEELYVLHSCDNPACINPEHLRQGTALDNARDRDSRGRRAESKPPTLSGEDSSVAKLTRREVEEIRERCKQEPKMTQAEIGAMYGISRTNVGSILRNETWVE